MRWRFTLIGLLIFGPLAACSPTTSLRNDTNATVYVDILKNGVPRPPSTQKLSPGNVMTTPWPPREANVLYVGDGSGKLRRFAIAGLCNMSKPNCDLLVSQLPLPTANGS